VNVSLRQAVRDRAQLRCEYCHLPELQAPFTSFQIEHVIARQHEGKTVLSNLAFACHRCNLSKGPNLAGITKRTVRLFHPRRMKWPSHFR
jgi:5-methylcytosine-specific restriction endonuclease McrA